MGQTTKYWILDNAIHVTQEIQMCFPPLFTAETVTLMPFGRENVACSNYCLLWASNNETRAAPSSWSNLGSRAHQVRIGCMSHVQWGELQVEGLQSFPFLGAPQTPSSALF